MFVNVISSEEKLGEKRTQLTRGCTRQSNPAQLHNDFIPVIEVVELLRIVANLHFCAPANFSGERSNLLQDCFEKGGLAGSVRPNNSETLTAAEDKRNVASQHLLLVTNRRLINRQDVVSRTLDGFKPEVS